jgi:hypothetical protein
MPRKDDDAKLSPDHPLTPTVEGDEPQGDEAPSIAHLDPRQAAISVAIAEWFDGFIRNSVISRDTVALNYLVAKLPALAERLEAAQV